MSTCDSVHLFVADTIEGLDLWTSGEFGGSLALISNEITNEISNILKGVQGEKDTAYHINFDFNPGKNWAVIHDLRVEHKRRTAQIDHILMNRFLQVWICETKYFSQGFSFNDLGEFISFYGKKPVPIASPLEKNRRHISVFDNLVKDKVIDMPKRLGLSLKPDIGSRIVVSTNASITRPETHVENRMDKGKKSQTPFRVFGQQTLKRIATQMASHHTPDCTDWHGKFVLSKPALHRNCPKCGEGMIIRTASKGKNVGNQFWGCSKFPRCWGRMKFEA